MTTSIPPARQPKQGWGFTLLELLLVVAIMALLLGLVAGATRSFRENIHLARAGQMLVDEIGVARQMASAQNWTVYVYFYKVPAQSSVGYSALQLWRAATPNGATNAPTMVPVGQARSLPLAIVISEDATHNSPLLGMLSAQTNKPPSLTGLPPTLTDATYAAFAVKPSGMLALDGDLTSASTLVAGSLTIVPVRNGTQTMTPSNFVTVQINPSTGNLFIYRP